MSNLFPNLGIKSRYVPPRYPERLTSKYVGFCEPHDLCRSFSTLPLQYRSSHEQYGNSWMELRFSKTLFIKTTSGPDSALQAIIGWSRTWCWRILRFCLSSENPDGLVTSGEGSGRRGDSATRTTRLLFLRAGQSVSSPTSPRCQELCAGCLLWKGQSGFSFAIN